MGGSLGGSQESGTQQVVNKNEPPEYLKPYYVDIANRAAAQSQTPQQYYPGSTVVGFNPLTEQGLQQQANIAKSQFGANQGNINELNKTIAGDYLYGGQGFNAALDAAKRKILPEIAGSYARAGQYGDSSRRELEQTQALGDVFAGQYGQERTNQQRAQQLLPQALAAQYDPANQLQQVGGAYETQQGQYLQDAINRFNFQQQEPAARLAQYSGLLSGVPGSTSTQQTPLYSNRAASGLGGALAGAKLGGSFGPVGAGLGAGLGLLFS